MRKKRDKIRILVVDDDRHLADAIVAYLNRLDYLAEAAYGGAKRIGEV